jgi:peptidyl-tRNA hydrolase, PTH1 family
MPRKQKLLRRTLVRNKTLFFFQRPPGIKIPGGLFIFRKPLTFTSPKKVSSVFRNTPYRFDMKYLIAGLGNPGPEYELTRHNIGFLILDRLADNNQISFQTGRLADKAELKYKGKQLHLIKPNTYMNLSGKAVSYWLKELKIPKENLLVIVDDLALPFGNLRLRAKGSSAGHNGLKDIEQILSGQDYARLRFGIGNNFSKGKQADFVLSNFEQTEFETLPSIMDKSIEIILSFCTIGIERTMSTHNS